MTEPVRISFYRGPAVDFSKMPPAVTIAGHPPLATLANGQVIDLTELLGEARH